jgi:hypothetical protein
MKTVAALFAVVLLTTTPAFAQPSGDGPRVVGPPIRPSAPAAAAASTSVPEQQPLKSCDEEASRQRLVGGARAAFMSKCLATRATNDQKGSTRAAPIEPSPAGKHATTPTPQSEDSAAARRSHEAQQERWNAQARRAMGTICRGCTGQSRSRTPMFLGEDPVLPDYVSPEYD